MRSWPAGLRVKVPARSTLADAIRYALGRWTGLTRFLDDGRIELDTNPVERAIRPVALGRNRHHADLLRVADHPPADAAARGESTDLQGAISIVGALIRSPKTVLPSV